MEDHKPSLMKHAMTYGAIIGLVLVVYNILLYITGLTFNKGLGYIVYVVLFAGIYFASKAYRDKVLGGFITYGRALGLGVLISIFVGIISVFFNFIMMRFIDPGLIDKSMAILEEYYQNSSLIPDDQVDEVLEKVRVAMVSVWSLPVAVFAFTFFGFIISLLTSIFVKRDPNPFA
jgi:hypothetical protein